MSATQAPRVAERPGEEIWELMVDGRIHVEITNHRGRPQDLSVRGKGARLRLSTTDREIAQERVRDAANDPFVNGMLRRIDSAASEADRAPDELDDDDLKSVFGLTDEFEDIVGQLSEINIRRMSQMAVAVDATASQIAFLKALIEERWPIGGDTPTYREMRAAPM